MEVQTDCARCGGSGKWGPKECFGCHGVGYLVKTVQMEPDRKTLRKIEQAYQFARPLIAGEANGTLGYELRKRPVEALQRLRAEEPERLVKLADSLRRGQIGPVMTALLEY